MSETMPERLFANRFTNDHLVCFSARIEQSDTEYVRVDLVPTRPEPSRLEMAAQIYCAKIVSGFTVPEDAQLFVKTSFDVADALIAESRRRDNGTD